MKGLLCALAFLLAMAVPAPCRCEENLQSVMEQVIASLESDALEQAGAGLTDWLGDDLIALVREIASGQASISMKEIGRILWMGALESLSAWGRTAMSILFPAFMCAVVTLMSETLSSARASKIAHFSCFLLLLVPLTSLTLKQVEAVQSVISEMSGRMRLIFPPMLTLLSAVGASATSAFLQPALLSASAAMTQVITHVTLRLCICTCVLTAVNHLSERAHLGRLCAVFRHLVGWSMGICFTVFLGVMAIQGAGMAVSDGISLRMAKYAVNHLVPVVGGMFSDTVDMLVGCSLLVKNALGAVSLLILLAVIFAPLLHLGVTQLMIRLCAAVMEPVAEPQIVSCMDDFAGVLSLLLTTLLLVGAMFFLLVAQLLLLGNLTVMMR